jgi:CheY-like chemotaxis protein
LVADDSEMVRNALVSLISGAGPGYVCAEAADGLQALERAQDVRPDLVLLDINMPRANGLEVARRLRKDMPQVVIFIMSQNDAAMLLPGAREAGADGCLDKSDIVPGLMRSLKDVEHRKSSDVKGDA